MNEKTIPGVVPKYEIVGAAIDDDGPATAETYQRMLNTKARKAPSRRGIQERRETEPRDRRSSTSK